MKKLKLFCVLLFSFFVLSCEEKISEDDLNSYKSIMDVRLGHLGNAIIIQGRLLDAFNLRNDRYLVFDRIINFGISQVV